MLNFKLHVYISIVMSHMLIHLKKLFFNYYLSDKKNERSPPEFKNPLPRVARVAFLPLSLHRAITLRHHR